MITVFYLLLLLSMWSSTRLSSEDFKKKDFKSPASVNVSAVGATNSEDEDRLKYSGTRLQLSQLHRFNK